MSKCIECGKDKSRKGIYCKSCSYKHRTRPSGLKYKIIKENPTSFKKGQSPWNKGKHGIYSEEFLKKLSLSRLGKRYSPETEFKYINGNGYRHLLYKGILRQECSECPENNLKRLHVHHINHNRKDNRIENLITLCRPCHLAKHGKTERNYTEGRKAVA